MATPSSYYINGPSLASATAVFTDSALTTCALDGFYSDGVISREQVDCVLLPQQTCTSCSFPHNLGYSAVDCTEACADIAVTYYSNCEVLVLYDCYLWEDEALTIEAPAGFYSDGINCYDYRFPESGFIAITACSEPVSFNCVSGTCIDPGDGSGTYATLVECEAVCSLTPVTSYNCVSGTCTEVMGSGGTYINLEACEAACEPPAINVNCTIYDDTCTPIGSIVVFPGDGASVGLYYRIDTNIIYYVNNFTSVPYSNVQTMGTGYALCPPPA
jgi:hypothetical protein